MEESIAAGKAEKGYGIMKKLSKGGRGGGEGRGGGSSVECAEKRLGLKKALVSGKGFLKRCSFA